MATDYSSNDELINEIAPNQMVIIIAPKGDVSEVFNNYIDIINGSLKNEAFRKTVLQRIDTIAKTKIDSMLKKGIVKPKIYLIYINVFTITLICNWRV